MSHPLTDASENCIGVQAAAEVQAKADAKEAAPPADAAEQSLEVLMCVCLCADAGEEYCCFCGLLRRKASHCDTLLHNARLCGTIQDTVAQYSTATH